MNATKREILFALVALGCGASGPALAQESAGLDLSAGRVVGEAYRAAHPENMDAVRAALIPNGLDDEALARLRARVVADFAANNVFIYEGWRMSRTEGQLFALLA